MFRNPEGSVVLSGECPVEDAEPLLQLLQSSPGAPLDWTQCSGLHMAVLQVVLAVSPRIAGPCGDPFVAEWLS